jgi:hypothetical protein
MDKLDVKVFEQRATSPCSQAAGDEDVNYKWAGNCGCTCLCPVPPKLQPNSASTPQREG